MTNEMTMRTIGENGQSYYEDFIGHYPEVLSPELCDTLIVIFDQYDLQGTSSIDSQLKTVLDRKGHTPKNHLIDDTSIGLDEFVWNSQGGTLYTSVATGENGYATLINNCISEYMSNYGPLLEAHELIPFQNINFKMQRSLIGQGYNVFHSENIGDQNGRALAWLAYLNDVEEGGETEFLYYNRRIVPKKGTVVIWPAGFTHTHRGNPPLSNTKYVMTGWVTRHNPNL